MKKYYIRATKEFGRGIFAARDFMAGEIICVCELLILSERDTQITENTDLKRYTFKFNELQDCLVLGDGELFNHADKENVSYTIEQTTDHLGPKKVMVFKTIKPILEDEQMFINYSRDIEVDINKYNVNLTA